MMRKKDIQWEAADPSPLVTPAGRHRQRAQGALFPGSLGLINPDR